MNNFLIGVFFSEAMVTVRIYHQLALPKNL